MHNALDGQSGRLPRKGCRYADLEAPKIGDELVLAVTAIFASNDAGLRRF